MKIKDIDDEYVSKENHLDPVIGGNDDLVTSAKKKKKRNSSLDITLENDTSMAEVNLGNGDARENLNDSLGNGDSSPKVKHKKKKKRESNGESTEQITYTDVMAAENTDVELSAKKKKKRKDIPPEALEELLKLPVETPSYADSVDGSYSYVDENEGRSHKKKKRKHSLDKTLEDADISAQAGVLDTSVTVHDDSVIAGVSDLELSGKKKKKRKNSADNSESLGAVKETCDKEVVEAIGGEVLHKKHKKKKRESLPAGTESISHTDADEGNVCSNNLPESTNSEGVSNTDTLQKKMRKRNHSQEDTPLGLSSETPADGKSGSASSGAKEQVVSAKKKKGNKQGHFSKLKREKKKKKMILVKSTRMNIGKNSNMNIGKNKRTKRKKKTLKKKKNSSLAKSSSSSKEEIISETSVDEFLSRAREEASKPPPEDKEETTSAPQRDLLKNWFKEASGPSANEKIASEEKAALAVPEESAGKDETSDDAGFTLLNRIKEKSKKKLEWVLPRWLSNPTMVSLNLADGPPIRSLEGIDPFLSKRLNSTNIRTFFPVQAAVIPELLASSKLVSMRYRPRDVCVSAPTGSGKTLAYALPIIQSLLNRVVPQLRAVILLPTKELAEQVYNVFVTYTRFSQLKMCLATGNHNFQEEQKSLVFQDSAGNCSADILVATPGRLADHLSYTEGFTLRYVRFFVLDEADLFLSSHGGSLILQIEQLKKQLHRPISDNSSICGGFQAKDSVHLPEPFLQQILVSATLVHEPEQLKILDLHRPKLFIAMDEHGPVKSSGKISTYTRPQELREEYIVIDPGIKPLILSHLLSKYELRRVLVFTSSTLATKSLCIVLSELCKDYRIARFSSFEAKRRHILADFANGKIDVLIASDAVARGIDIKDVGQVVSYDVPSVQTYVHRIGRTARAGKQGFALTLVEDTPQAENDFKTILNSCNNRIYKIDVSEEELTPYVSQYQDALATLKEKMLKIKKRNKLKKSLMKKSKWKNQKLKKRT